MSHRLYYAFALGYKNGLEGNTECPVKFCPEFQQLYDEGYEQGAADDMYGEINAFIFED